MRKRRSDSILGNLAEATQREIFRLCDNEGYDTAVEILKQPVSNGGFDLKISRSALQSWYKGEQNERFLQRLRDNSRQMEAAEKDFRESAPEYVDNVILAGIRETVVDMMASEQIDPKGMAMLYGLILKDKQQKLDLEKWRMKIKDGIQVGLDALYEEIKGNSEAVALFEQLRDTVIQSVEAA